MDDLIDDLMVFDKGDDMHLASASRTEQRIDLIDFGGHLRPAFARDISALFLNYRKMRSICSSLTLLTSVGIRIKAVITDHNLAFTTDMGGDPGDEIQVIHLFLTRIVFPILIAHLAFSLLKA